MNAISKYITLLKKNRDKNFNELTIFITNYCNLSCQHCFYPTNINNSFSELSAEPLRKLASSLPSTCKKIILTGGEPFMRDDLPEIIRIFSRYGIKDFTIATNGTLTDNIKKFIDSLFSMKEVRVFFSVSLDGPERIHDRIRKQEGAFQKTINTLKIMKEKNIFFGIQTVVSELNYKAIESFDKYINDNFKTEVHYQFIRSAQMSGLPCNLRMPFNPLEKLLLPTIDDIEKFLVELKRIYLARGNRLNNFLKHIFDFTILECKYLILKTQKMIFPCLAGKSNAVVYPCSEVAICEYIIPVKTNLKTLDYNFNRLWNSPEIESQRKISANCYCTHGCFINMAGNFRFLIYFSKNFLIFSYLLSQKFLKKKFNKRG